MKSPSPPKKSWVPIFVGEDSKITSIKSWRKNPSQKCRLLFLLSNVQALKTVKRCSSARPHKLWSLPCWKGSNFAIWVEDRWYFFRVNIAGYTLRMISGPVNKVGQHRPRSQMRFNPPKWWSVFRWGGKQYPRYTDEIHFTAWNFFCCTQVVSFRKKKVRCVNSNFSCETWKSSPWGISWNSLMYNVQRDPYICNHKW